MLNLLTVTKSNPGYNDFISILNTSKKQIENLKKTKIISKDCDKSFASINCAQEIQLRCANNPQSSKFDKDYSYNYSTGTKAKYTNYFICLHSHLYQYTYELKNGEKILSSSFSGKSGNAGDLRKGNYSSDRKEKQALDKFIKVGEVGTKEITYRGTLWDADSNDYKNLISKLQNCQAKQTPCIVDSGYQSTSYGLEITLNQFSDPNKKSKENIFYIYSSSKGAHVVSPTWSTTEFEKFLPRNQEFIINDIQQFDKYCEQMGFTFTSFKKMIRAGGLRRKVQVDSRKGKVVFIQDTFDQNGFDSNLKKSIMNNVCLKAGFKK
jgi:hypothetical protein